MSKSSQNAKIEFILKMIENIETIVKRHKNITTALSDEVEAKPAILMALLQIGESIRKLDENTQIKYNLKEEVKGAYSVRNFIAHDYEGVDMGLIEVIIRDKIPKLKEKLTGANDE